MKTPEKHKCDRCLNSRPIVSETGLHWVCSLHPKKSVDCFIGAKDWFIPEETGLEDALKRWNRMVTDESV